MQKSKKFLYLALLMSSSSSWRIESNWLNSQSSRVASSWKYEQLDSNRVENVSNLTRSRFEFKMSTWNSTWRSVYCTVSYFFYETILFLMKSFSFFFLTISYSLYITKMKIKSSNARVQTLDLCIYRSELNLLNSER